MADGTLRVWSEKRAVRKPSLQRWRADPPPQAPRLSEQASPDATDAAALVATMAQAEEAERQKQRELEERAAAQVTGRPPAGVKPLDLVHFPPLRGLRRERLRREAQEARARLRAGQPGRATPGGEPAGYPPAGSPVLPRGRPLSPPVRAAREKCGPAAAGAPPARTRG